MWPFQEKKAAAIAERLKGFCFVLFGQWSNSNSPTLFF
jgi:hypothetical protein